MNNLFLRDGKTPSAYGLACGYIQHHEREKYGKLYEVQMYKEHNAYHIKYFIYKDAYQAIFGDRILWYTYEGDELTKARQKFNELKKQIDQ